MLVDSLLQRVEVSLSLVITDEMVQTLSGELDTAGTILICASVTVLISGVGHMLQALWTHSLVAEITALMRSISLLVTTRIVLDGIGVKGGRSTADIFADVRVAVSGQRSLGWGGVPLTVVEVVEPFVLSSAMIILIVMLCNILRGGNRPVSSVVPEIDRIVYGVQYMFADAVGGLFTDPVLQRNIVFLGMLGLQRIAQYSRAEGTTTPGMFLHALAMAWTNVVVQWCVTENSSPGGVLTDLVATVCLALVIQMVCSWLPGAAVLRGYVEWHLSSVLMAMFQFNAADPTDVIVLSLSVMTFFWVCQAYTAAGAAGHPGYDMVYSTFALVLSNSSVRWGVRFMSRFGGMHNTTAVLATIVLSKGMIHVLRKGSRAFR